jgi:transcriptional regulator with XRE-family HTH domain
MTAHTPSIGVADLVREWRVRQRVSQLELALRAGTTQRHVSFIERGRSLPGRSMIVRLAEALEVPLRERNTMLLSAGYAPAYPETSLDDPQLDSIRIALERILDGHRPYPAVITDVSANLVSSNDAFRALLDDVSPRLLEPPSNIGRLLLHPEGLAPRILNIDEWGKHVIDGLRRKAARHPGAGLQSLADELEALVPPHHSDNSPSHLGFAVPLRLRAAGGELQLLTTLTHFATAAHVTVSELTLEAFLPGDQATAAYLSKDQRGILLSDDVHPGVRLEHREEAVATDAAGSPERLA